MSVVFTSYAFGCRVNQAEQIALDQRLIDNGWTPSQSPDILLINTCAITHKAVRELRQLVYQQVRHNPNIKIILLGCAVSGDRGELGKLPNIAFIIPNRLKPQAFDILQAHFKNTKTNGKLNINNKFTNSQRRIIKIQDGCARQCSYCIVPQLRGKPTSVPIAEVIEMIKAKPASEIVLTAINTEMYGIDINETFNNLIKQIVTKAKVTKLSFGSVNPWSLNSEFIDIYRKYLHCPLAPALHIPLQSGSNKMLAIMRRGYTVEDILPKLQELAQLDPFMALTTDIIVGHPRETETDFQATYDFLQNSPFVRFHIFRYSPRPNTYSAQLKDHFVEPSMQKQRAQQLQKLSQQKYQQFLKKHAGNKFKAILLKHDQNHSLALLPNQITIKVPKNNVKIGEFFYLTL